MQNFMPRGTAIAMIACMLFGAGCNVLTPPKKTDNNAASGTQVNLLKADSNTAAGEHAAINNAARKVKPSALSEGVDLYNQGNYNEAIKRLSSDAEIGTADKPFQIEALKYIAFSYCLTSRPMICKQYFEKALKLDPNFDLEPGEKGHPLWSPVFERAKKGALSH